MKKLVFLVFLFLLKNPLWSQSMPIKSQGTLTQEKEVAFFILEKIKKIPAIMGLPFVSKEELNLNIDENSKKEECFHLSRKNITIKKECLKKNPEELIKNFMHQELNKRKVKLKATKNLSLLLDIEALTELSFFNLPGIFEIESLIGQQQGEYLWQFHYKAIEFWLTHDKAEIDHPMLSAYLEKLGSISKEKSQKNENEGLNPSTHFQEKQKVFTAPTNYLYLPDPERAWENHIKMIKSAKKRIWMSYFIWSGDTHGLAMATLLAEKLKENPNLDVQILIDARGYGHDEQINLIKKRKMFSVLANLGAKIKVYNPYSDIFKIRHKGEFFATKVVASNHDKITLVDDDYFFLGGRNMGSAYYMSSEEAMQRDVISYHDTSVALQSAPLANQVGIAFQSEFENISSRNWKVPIKFKDLKEFDVETSQVEKLLFPFKDDFKEFDWDETSAPAQIWDKHSRLGTQKSMEDRFIDKIKDTKHELVIQNPYIVLPPRLREALVISGQQAQIKVQLPYHDASTQYMVQNYIELNHRPLLEDIPGLEIHARKGPTLLHSKVMVFDQKSAFIGSYNLDYLSANFNSEIGVYIESSALAQRIRQEILSDFHPEQSIEYTKEGPKGLTKEEKKLRRKVNLRKHLYYLLQNFL